MNGWRRYWYLWLAAVALVVICLTVSVSIEHEWYKFANRPRMEHRED